MKKQKKFGRKLALNKQTIAMLHEQSTKKVFAGYPHLNSVDTCFSHCDPCTNERMPCDCMWPRTY